MVVLDDRVPASARLAHTDASGGQRAARAQLRGQIAGLERQLARAVVDGWPRVALPAAAGAAVRPGPRLLNLGELERVRDELADRVAGADMALRRRAELQAGNRDLLERMLLEPGRHRFVRVTRADVGEPGCGAWHVRPRLGLVGMLMGWWHVKLSSGCPLAT